MPRMSAANAELLRVALEDQATIERYRGHIHPRRYGGRGCLLWTGAISARGHGRFWIGEINCRDITVVAHRFGYGLRFGYDALVAAMMIRHDCDNVLCQETDHMRAGTALENGQDWSSRRNSPGSPLHDLRGSWGRAYALREAARRNGSIEDAARDGFSDLDRYQDPLFTE